MENNMSRVLVETVALKALERIKDNPERGIRNMIDMALQFSKGRFQQNFFTTAQTMLQNENSAYYALVRDVVLHTDTDRLFTFGMNLGYNGCTVGARRIRENEKKMDCNIPWAVTIQIDASRFSENQRRYHAVIQEGEALGIYVWMLFPSESPQRILSLAQEHGDSAFCIFCNTDDLTAAFLDDVALLHNVMLVVRYDENETDVYATLKSMGLLYSVWHPYGQADVEMIINGDLFSSTQQLTPTFTVFLAEPDCSDMVQRLAYQSVRRARSEQTYRTLLWEFQGDISMVDAVISDDTCSVCFDQNGDLCDWHNKNDPNALNILKSDLAAILMCARPKKADKEKTGKIING